MTTAADIETADRLSRRRARALPVLAIIFISQQAAFLSGPAGDAVRTVDHVKIGAWLVLSLVLLLGLGTGGFWFRPKRVRALVEDEVTRANRRSAYEMGFWTAAGMSLGLYVVTLFEPVSGREAIHIILTGALGAALLTFGLLERRALKDG